MPLTEELDKLAEAVKENQGLNNERLSLLRGLAKGWQNIALMLAKGIVDGVDLTPNAEEIIRLVESNPL